MPHAPDTTHDDLSTFRWEPQPEAFAWLNLQAERLCERLPPAAAWAKRLRDRSGNRFIDLIDAVYPATDDDLQRALHLGWTPAARMNGYTIHRNASGVFPEVVVPDAGPCGVLGIDLKCDAVEDFFTANGVHTQVVGSRRTRYRWACVWQNDAAALGVAERLGFDGVGRGEAVGLDAVDHALQGFRNRERGSADPTADAEAFDVLHERIDDAVASVGVDVACHLFFQAEREYWQTRNHAARVQHHRQQAVGIGWANHDHHTYRSSRAAFPRTIEAFEKLGLHCRERFYPGGHAGWGAQVLEQPVTRIVVFADVDMSPDELRTDFPHAGFAADHTGLNTVGLWCALHGESILHAGMHHLECMFDFDALAQGLKRDADIDVLKPFSDFDYLKQQFTAGEWWPVAASRVDALLAGGQITGADAERFKRDGAIGSHLENLQRNDGFKGFNQTGVDAIIAETDPRRQAAGGT